MPIPPLTGTPLAAPNPQPGGSGGLGPPSGFAGGPGTITGPGTAFGHDYQVVVGTMTAQGFVPFGEVQAAIPTTVNKELNALGGAQFTFPQDGVPGPTLVDRLNRDASLGLPVAASGGIPYNSGQYLLPPSVFPAVRDVQIWRDGVPIQWCLPITGRGDNKTVTVDCSGLLWLFSRINFGPTTRNYVTNGEFEEGLTSWTAVNVTASVETVIVNRGKQSARLSHRVYDDQSYITQTFTYTAPITEGTFFDLSASICIDPAIPFVGGAIADLSLYMEGREAGTIVQKATAFVDNTFAANATPGFNRQDTAKLPAFIVPAGHTWDIEVRLYCGDCDMIYDSVVVNAQESVGSDLAGSDVTDIIQRVVIYASDPLRGKSPLNLPFLGVPTGTVLQRFYQFADNANILDALNEYPTIGICDFDIIWDATGTWRWFKIFPPAKGSIKLNQVIEIDAGQPDPTALSFESNGSKTASAVRNLGQGTGQSRLLGYAVDASALGGRSVTDAATTYNTTAITSATIAFTAADVGIGVYGPTIPIGAVIASVTDAAHAVLNLPALGSGTGLFLGIGGLILDEVMSAVAGTPDRLLQGQALTELSRSRQATLVPTSTLRADGPNGKFGLIDTGDIIVSLVDEGWAQEAGEQRRVVKWELKPPTEEFLVTHNHI